MAVGSRDCSECGGYLVDFAVAGNAVGNIAAFIER